MPEIWNFTAQDPYEAMQAGMAQARANKLNDIKVAQEVNAFKQTQTLNTLMKSAIDPVTGKIDANKLAIGMANAGFGAAVPGMQKEYAGLQEAQSKAAKEQADASSAQTKAFTDRMTQWRQLLPDDPARAAAWMRAVHQDNVIGPELGKIGTVDDAIAKIPTDPKQYAKWKEQMVFAADEAVKRSTMTATEAATAATAARNATTAEGQLAVAQQRESRLATEAKAAEDQSIMGHDALVNAATRYNIDGTLPPLGMGKAGAKTRGAILDMAAELAKGIDPTDQRIRQISTKANSSALADLSKREAQVGAFERNFVRNADIVEKMSTKMDQSGSPIIQKWINAGKKKVGGDPEIAALDVAIKAVVNEYGKIVSGSMGNTAVAQSEIKRMEDLLNNANTTEQVIAILNTMRQETNNRMTGFKEEKDRLRGDISAKPAAAATAPPAPAAPPAAVPGGIVNVKTVEEARNLAPGTQFRTPDGRIKVR